MTRTLKRELLLGSILFCLLMGMLFTGFAALIYLFDNDVSGRMIRFVAVVFHTFGLALFARYMLTRRARFLASIPILAAALLWGMCAFIKFLGYLPTFIPELAHAQFFLYASMIALPVTLFHLRRLEREKEEN